VGHISGKALPKIHSHPTTALQRALDTALKFLPKDWHAALAKTGMAVGQPIEKVKHELGKALMDPNTPNDKSCANFVSACLEKAGLIKPGQRSNMAADLEANLQKSGKFRQVSLSKCKPGDVVFVGQPTYHACMVLTTKDGRATSIIGAINNGPNFTQTVSATGLWGTGLTVWQPV
jgi:hypothetical protein